MVMWVRVVQNAFGTGDNGRRKWLFDTELLSLKSQFVSRSPFRELMVDPAYGRQAFGESSHVSKRTDVPIPAVRGSNMSSNWRRHVPALGGLLASLCIGCTGSIAGPGGEASSSPPGSGLGGSAAGAGNQPGVTGACDGLTPRRVRRLAKREYVNIVTDLLGAAAGTAVQKALPQDARVGGFDNQDSFLFVSASLQESLADLAANLASQADPVQVAPCDKAAGSPGCVQAFIQSFASKAYGRPLTAEELDRATKVASTGQDYAASVRLVIELTLQSPNLLYLSELGAPTAAVVSQAPVPLTPHEIASQLSFLLSGTRPDATLLRAAESGALATATGIRQQAERLLQTPRGAAELSRFMTGWVDMGPIVDVSKSATAFPEFTPDLANAMQQEFDQFVTTQLKGGEGTLSSFMTATSTNVPPALAAIYGPDLTSSGLDTKHRQGVLSLPGLLVFHSSDVHSGPVERGLLIRRQLLCQEVPPPPQAAVDRIVNNPVDDADTTKTTRQKFEAHVNEATCKACHQSFDPIGFGLEQMDGLGRFRTMEHGLPVDSHGELTGTDVDGVFEGPAELSSKLAQSQVLASCLASRFFSFALARPSGARDACVVDAWASTFKQGGGRIKDLVLAYVSDTTFVTRREDR
jgi:Protein of unknown function (DUF1592)/Protein of unknown function (DUF1588)/Protein of unknown function (DUF1585)/Protein of unknown function (DUF1595)/Protein of unknown function (DUF1587)